MPEMYQPGWEADFERELGSELHRLLDPISARPIPARRSMPVGGSLKKVLGGAGAAIGVKVLTGFAVAAAAATFAVAAGEVAKTGSVNPLNWGQQVKQQVADCKASAARLGAHAIGQCVAPSAQKSGEAVSDSPKTTGGPVSSEKTDTGNTDTGKTDTGTTETGSGDGKDKSKSNGQGSDKQPGGGSPIATAGEPTDPPMVVVRAPIPPQE